MKLRLNICKCAEDFAYRRRSVDAARVPPLKICDLKTRILDMFMRSRASPTNREVSRPKYTDRPWRWWKVGRRCCKGDRAPWLGGAARREVSQPRRRCVYSANDQTRTVRRRIRRPHCLRPAQIRRGTLAAVGGP